MKRSRISKVALIVCLITLLPMIVSAAGQNQRPRRLQGPPPEAIAACDGKDVGDSVTFKGRRGENLEATCQEKDGQLAAVPNDMPEGGGPR